MLTYPPMSLSVPTNTSIFRSWAVILASALFFFYICFQINVLNTIGIDIAKELHFNSQQISKIFSCFSYGMVLFLFPAGLLVDRFSASKLLFTAFAISIASTFVISTTSNFWVISIARLTIGVTGAFAMSTPVKLASRWFDSKHMATAISLVLVMGTMGGIVAQTPMALLTQKFGWRLAVQSMAFIGLILLALQLFLVRDKPQWLKNSVNTEHDQSKKLGFWHSLGIAITNKQNWLCGIYLTCMNLPLFILGGVWGIPYLTQVHNLSHIQAATLTAMIFTGIMIGSPTSAIISDRIRLRKLPLMVGAILSILVMGTIMFISAIPFALGIFLYLALGLALSIQGIAYPTITESNSYSITATANSFAVVLVMFGGMLAPFFGWLLGFSGNGQIIDNVTVYSSADFIRANYLLFFGLIIALTSSSLIKETYCKSIVKNSAL